MGSAERNRALRAQRRSAEQASQPNLSTTTPTPQTSFASQWQRSTPKSLYGNQIAGWRDSVSLRTRGVQFVSGGNLMREEHDSDVQEGREDIGERFSTVNSESFVAESLETSASQQQSWVESESERGNIDPAGADDEDLIELHDEALSTGDFKIQQERPTSSSSTSTEIIIFKGRGQESTQKQAQAVSSISKASDNPWLTRFDNPLETNLQTPYQDAEKIRSGLPAQEMVHSPGLPSTNDSQSTPKSIPVSLHTKSPAFGLDSTMTQLSKLGRKNRRRSRKRLTANAEEQEQEQDDEEEDIIQRDYIDNIKSRSQMESLSIVDDDPSSVGTSDDKWSNIVGVIERRYCSSGAEYLVIPSDPAEDAQWISHTRLTSKTALDHVLAFEKSQKQLDNVEDWPSTGESHAVSDLLLLDKQAEHDENTRLAKQTSYMSDAEIARILNKQVELGFDDENVVLFDDAAAATEDSAPLNPKSSGSNRTPPTPRHRSKKGKGKGKSFPDAGALADALDEDPYRGFDIMDFDRPSLKPKKKGRKSAQGLAAELEELQAEAESSLADQLAQSWENDRAKKRVKKAEREKLRQEGLLGTKSGKSGKLPKSARGFDNHPFNDGVYMGINGFTRDQLCNFLVDETQDDLVLPPMSSPQRAQVHQLAKALSLQSRSHGSEASRHTVLTKSSYSAGYYHEGNIWEIENLLTSRRYAHIWSDKRPFSGRSKPSGGCKGLKSGGGGNTAAASYKDGDVVGAYAPEIGIDNKGRAMLEKMGWSSGMGIGKEGNKGSTDVITHVVKNSKTGLG